MAFICPVFKWHSNNGPFSFQPLSDYLNIKLVCNEDPHCNLIFKKTHFFAEVLLGGVEQHGDQVSGLEIRSHRAQRTSSLRRSHCLFGKGN